VPGDPSPAQAQQPKRDRGSGRRDDRARHPEHIRSDNGPEFVAQDLRKWLAATGTKTLYIEPGSPWENGYCESFNSKLRDEFLNGEIFYSLKEVQVLADRWRVYYNHQEATLIAGTQFRSDSRRQL
jgi:transposase InsO family protein